MASPVDPANSGTEHRILTAAFSLFGRFGYDGVSMQRVADDSGITKAALYWHFESKERLYARAMTELVGVFQHHIFSAIGHTPDPVERIFAMFAGLERLVIDPRLERGVAGYWLKPSTADVSQASAVLTDFETGAAEMIEATLKEACASRALEVEGSTRDMARAFIALLEAIVLPLGHRSASDHHRLVGVLAHIFFRAHARSPELAERAAHGLGPRPAFQ